MTHAAAPGIDVAQLKPGGQFAVVDGYEYHAMINSTTNRVVIPLYPDQPRAARLGEPHAIPISGNLQYAVDVNVPDRVFWRWDYARYRSVWIWVNKVVDDGAVIDGAVSMDTAWQLGPDDPYRYQGRDHEDQRIRLPIDKIDEVIVREADHDPRPVPIDPSTVFTVYRWPPEPTGYPAPPIP